MECEVIAPSLIPEKASERIKTDRRDAEKLARCYRAGELTAVAVPSPEQEALRDLVRAREAAKKDQLKAQEVALLNYLHEVEHVAQRIQHLEQAIDEAVREAPAELRAVIEALQALRGVAQTTAATIVSEVGTLSRFANPRVTAAWWPANTPAAEGSNAGRSLSPVTPICAGCWWSRPGRITTGRM